MRRGAVAAAGVLALAALPACGQSGEDQPQPTASEGKGGNAGKGGNEGTGADAGRKPDTKAAERRFKELEREFDARLGVYALDTGTGRSVGYRADDRFAYASTFKALAVGAVLRRYGVDGMGKVIHYSREDLVDNSPVTENFTETGMSLRELSAATLWYSDNTAVNLLLEDLGGPDALESVLEELGDDVTEMDRYEPDLSEGRPGDVRDTSTPRAMTGSLRALLLGDALKRDERALLRTWMETNTTGETLIGAGVPKGWKVADKSGTAGYGGRNDIAVLWPEDGGNPVVLSVLSSRDEDGAERDDALIAGAAKAAVTGLGR
ncbi:class A beta-lactamase [Streptomyces sp. NPDC088387]|uniref:class A beta-lactamase n=1 Tax=Streptomyces sp. NPDC088387 TaxID=3365859 RepID=UPI00380E7346